MRPMHEIIKAHENGEELTEEEQMSIDSPPPEGVAVSKGLGDTIAKITSLVGVKPCGGCKERQKKLNRLFPYEEKGKTEV